MDVRIVKSFELSDMNSSDLLIKVLSNIHQLQLFLFSNDV